MIDLKTCKSGVLLKPLLRLGEKRGANHKNQAVNLHKKEAYIVQRKKTFLVVCVSILMSIARGQSSYSPPVEKIVPVHLVFRKWFEAPPPSAAAPKEPLPPFHFTAVDNLGFFCKKEILIQKTLHLPLYFRLGSLEYCNKLEGK
jgi:hypothetical protein